MNIVPDNTHFITGTSPAQDFTLNVVQNPSYTGGSGGTLVDADITFITTANATISNNFFITPTNVNVVITNDTPSVISLDTQGNATLLTNGLAQVSGILSGVGRRQFQQTMVNGAGTVATGISSYATGSLIKHLNDQMTALLTYINKVGGSNNANQQYTNYVAQTSTLMTGLVGVSGFTAFDATVVANNNISQQAQAWISPHHWISGIGAAHGAGATNGQTCLVGNDVVIGYSATPYAGTLARFLPTTWKSYLPFHASNFPTSGVPCWAKMTNTYDAGTSGQWIEPVMAECVVSAGDPTGANIKAPVNTLFKPFCRITSGVIGTSGDSGSPVFCAINGTPVLMGRVCRYGGIIDWYGNCLTAATTLWIGATDNTHQNDITSAMNLLASLNSDATVYALQYVDLSGFTTF